MGLFTLHNCCVSCSSQECNYSRSAYEKMLHKSKIALLGLRSPFLCCNARQSSYVSWFFFLEWRIWIQVYLEQCWWREPWSWKWCPLYATGKRRSCNPRNKILRHGTVHVYSDRSSRVGYSTHFLLSSSPREKYD